MLKKSILLLSLIIPFCIKAQLGVGSWYLYPTFQNVDQLIETSERVYCLSSGTLMMYDKVNDETYNFSVDNALTEARASKIYYNPIGKYLAVVYPSGNIDLIYDNGKSANLPDIRDAVLTIVPQINDVAFAKGLMAVATNFGVVLFDDKSLSVKQSGMYETNVATIGLSDELLMIYTDGDKKIRFIKNTGRINSLDNYNVTGTDVIGTPRHVVALGPNHFVAQIANGSSTSARLFTYYYDTNVVTRGVTGESGFTTMSQTADGCYFAGDKRICVCDAEGNLSYTTYPAELAGHTLTMWDDPTQIWAGNNEGFGCYSYADGVLTVLNDKIKGDVLTCAKVGCLSVSPSGKVYVSNRGYTTYHKVDWPSGRVPINVNVIENGKIRDVTPYDEKGVSKIVAGYNIIEDPNDPDTYYMPSYYDGLYRVTNGELVYTYNNTNSTMIPLAANRLALFSADIDPEGNIYISHWHEKNSQNGALHMLTNEGRLKESTTAADWKKYDVGEWVKSDVLARYCNKSKVVAMTWSWGEGIMFIDPATSEKNFVKTFVDQDNKEFTFNMVDDYLCLFEDSNGRLWVGFSQGVFIIPNPADFKGATVKIQRIKVPRNDGTNFADYLLESENVLAIDEDSMGRKWIATANSGVYLVSENGTEIIEHFTADNSMLTTNTVYDVACDPNSNAVYFGTVDGLFRYNSNAAPAAENYSDVYAYPNPVRPDYTGWITIRGLMENSLVKIADSAGQVFYQGRSQGGMVTWDGCDASGNRVKTGVYYVFASQSDGSDSSGAVTKILVVR